MRRSFSTDPRGFTLLEMMVATSVLALLLVLFAQITNRTVDATQLANRQMDAAAQARIALDRLASNFNAMLCADGIAPIVYKDTGDAKGGAKNDALTFLTNARPRTRSTVATDPWTRSRTSPGKSPKTTVIDASGPRVRISIGVMSVRWWPRPLRKSDSLPKATRCNIQSR